MPEENLDDFRVPQSYPVAMIRLVAFHSGNIDSETLSGGERYAFELWTHLTADARYDVCVVVTACGVKVAEKYNYRLRVHQTDARPTAIGKSLLGYVPRLFRALAAVPVLGKFDVAYASSSYFYDVLPAIVAKVTRRSKRFVVPIFHIIPTPIQRDGNPLRNLLAWLEQRIMCALIGRTADLVIVDNADLLEALPRLGIPRSALFLSPMGVRPGPAVEPEEAVDAVYVGRITPAKGIVDLLDAWQIATSNRAWSLALIGNPEPGFDFEQLIQARGIGDRVRVLRGRSDSEVRGYVRSAKVFVTASREEGFGLSVLEALADGTPCVTYALPVFRQSFPVGRCEVPIGDTTALGRMLARVLEEDQERAAIREAIARHGRVGTWSDVTRTVASRIEQILDIAGAEAG